MGHAPNGARRPPTCLNQSMPNTPCANNVHIAEGTIGRAGGGWRRVPLQTQGQVGPPVLDEPPSSVHTCAVPRAEDSISTQRRCHALITPKEGEAPIITDETFPVGITLCSVCIEHCAHSDGCRGGHQPNAAADERQGGGCLASAVHSGCCMLGNVPLLRKIRCCNHCWRAGGWVASSH